MSQPDHVPVDAADRVRQLETVPPARRWKADRPADLGGRAPRGSGFGSQGTDQGYGLKLARRFADRLALAPGEHRDDVVTGCLGVGLKRASLFHRAPVIYDMELAFTLWGFLGGAPDDLIAFRAPLFTAATHHRYWDFRAIVDRVPEATLRLTPAQVRERLSDWRSLLTVDAPA